MSDNCSIVVATALKEKSQKILSFQGLQLSEAISNLDSNIIIHQSRNTVKQVEQEILKNAEENHDENNTIFANKNEEG